MARLSDSSKVRINLSLDPDVLAYIDSFALKNGIPRSGAISVMVMQYKQSMEGVSAMSGIVRLYNGDKLNQEKRE